MSEKYHPGEKVELKILQETELGFLAIINEEDQGLLYHNEIFERLRPYQILPGYIKHIRPDGRIDLQLKPFGNLGADELGQQILEDLIESGGYLPVNAKSTAEEIHNYFGVSKKSFKMAIGGLYKKRLINFTDTGMKVVK